MISLPLRTLDFGQDEFSQNCKAASGEENLTCIEESPSFTSTNTAPLLFRKPF